MTMWFDIHTEISNSTKCYVQVTSPSVNSRLQAYSQNGQGHPIEVFRKCVFPAVLGSRRGAGGTPYYGLCGEAPPERSAFFRVDITQILIWLYYLFIRRYKKTT